VIVGVKMMRILFRTLLLLVWMAGLDHTAQAERRVALVIGNAGYRFVSPLKNATEDASRVTQLLKQLDFDVTLGVDLDKIAMEATIRHFGETLAGADVALFYYSGHAIQVDDRNYILPVSAVSNQTSTTLDAVALQDISALLQAAGVKTSFLFLDACRNNPFSNLAGAASRGLGGSRGLARMTTTTGSLVVFSTSPGNVAFDGNGDVSPFTDAFVRYAAVPKLEVRQMLSRVRADVAEKTGNRQIPWDSSSLIGDFYLVPHRAPPMFESNVSVKVQANGGAQPLHLQAPTQAEGGDVKIHIRSLPKNGTLLLDSTLLMPSDEISPGQFTHIAYKPANPAILADAFNFEVDDAWGNSEIGLVTLAPGETKPVAEAPRPSVGTVEAKAVSLVGLGPNLIFTHPADLPADAGQIRVELASNIPFGQLLLGSRVIEVGRSIKLSELSQLTFIPRAGTDGRQVQAIFQPVDQKDGQVRVAIDLRLTDCDRLAGARLDPQGVSEGVLTGLIDTKLALPACEAAVKASPRTARYTYQLGRVVAALGRSAEAAALYQRATDLGHIRARHELGYIYSYGAGVPVDLERGRKELEQAVTDSDIFAMQTLGMLYYEGRGVDRDFERALVLFEQAARAGHTYAMNSLGRIYQRGEGVPVDLETTRRYWEESAARKDIYGINNLGFVYLDGIGANKDPAKAIGYFKQASDMGHPQAPNNLGRMYALGLGVPVDPAQARKWYSLGADRGDGWASFNLAEMNRLGLGNRADRVKATLYYARAASLNALEPAALSRKQLESGAKPEKLEALRTLLAKLEPSLSLPSSETALLSEATRIIAKHNEKVGDSSLEGILIAAARVDWQAMNVRADLF
jgi:TPR repeat protein